MQKNKTLKIEKEVLKNYLIQSPSKISIEKKKFQKTYFKNREKLYFECLKLPKKMFEDASLLDFGCGTGEHDVCYAKWGANLTLIDLNPVSTNQAKKYFYKFKLIKNLKKLITGSIYNFKSQEKFDLVISEGVLHHTEDPKGAFKIMTKYLKPGGFCILEIAFDTSHFQRSLHRFILDYLCDGTDKQIEKYSGILFAETINRAHKFGGRSKKQIIYDFYTNPKHKGINLSEILKWFKMSGLNYYSSYPLIEPEGFINGLHSKTLSEQINHQHLITFFQGIYFLIASDDDEKSFRKYSFEINEANVSWKKFLKYSKLSDYEYNNFVNLKRINKLFNKFIKNSVFVFNKRNSELEKKLIIFNKEFNKLIKSLKSKNLEAVKKNIKSFSYMFKGYNGVPSNFIVGYKK